MLIKRIAILGGTGFVGRALCNRLIKDNYEIKVLTRCREYNREDIILLPKLELVQTNIHDQEQLNQQLANCDAVINLVGILNEKGNNGKGFRQVHVELVKKMIQACRINNIHRILQMSALNADAKNGRSYYLRTKGEAEDILHTNNMGIHTTSFRPSVIFGKNDSFFNRFANLLKKVPIVFPLACYNSKFAPVYVMNVVETMTRALKLPESYGQRYQLCGPKIYTLLELVKYTADTIGIKRKIIPLNDTLSQIQAMFFDFVPGKPFSTDNYLSAQTDSICTASDLALFDVNATTIESIVPTYLNHYSYRSHYADFRSETRRH